MEKNNHIKLFDTLTSTEMINLYSSLRAQNISLFSKANKIFASAGLMTILSVAALGAYRLVGYVDNYLSWMLVIISAVLLTCSVGVIARSAAIAKNLKLNNEHCRIIDKKLNLNFISLGNPELLLAGNVVMGCLLIVAALVFFFTGLSWLTYSFM